MERKTNPDLPVVAAGWEGNIVIGGKFQNGMMPWRMPVTAPLKWMLGRNPQRKEKRADTFRLQVQPFDPAAMPENSLVWLGHSSFLIDLQGVRILTDPCFFNLATNKRRVALPCRAEQLKPVDHLLVSHDHRDHFDKGSARILARSNPAMEALVPLGGHRLFTGKTLRGVAVQEAGWYQEYRVRDGLRIIFLPSRHWGRRGLNDGNRTLWGSFLIVAGDTKIFFAGDTAYDGSMFKEIHDLFGDIAICLLPIGAYSPSWMMSHAHIDPEEAARIFGELGGKTLVPMHYGTYDLSDEPSGEPLARLLRSSVAANVKPLAVGEPCPIGI